MSWLSKLVGRQAPAATAGQGGQAEQGTSVQPLRIIIDSTSYLPEEFALGSFRIRPYDGDLIAKQQFDFRLSFTLKDEDIEFSCHGTVVKMDSKVGLVARFQQPQPYYERRLIEHIKATKGL